MLYLEKPFSESVKYKSNIITVISLSMKVIKKELNKMKTLK